MANIDSICSVQDCEALASSRGWCSKHYKRWLKHGNPEFINPKHIEGALQERFDAKYRVCPDTGCWLWEAHSQGGYGRIIVNKRSTLAHRVSYELHVGPIPEGGGSHGTCVCHSCDNPACVNPEHLFLGSNADNMADRNRKGRQAKLRGSKNGHSKLTEPKVKEIKQLLEQGMAQTAIAKRFGISQTNVSDIKNGRIWSQIE